MLAAMKNLRRWLLQGLWLLGLAAQAAAAVPDPSDYVRQLGASLLSEVRERLPGFESLSLRH